MADIDWSLDELVGMITGWVHVITYGFSGEECHKCGATINYFSGPGQFFCPRCGAYILQSSTGNRPWHEEPNYGPPAERLRQAYAQAKILTEAWEKEQAKKRAAWLKTLEETEDGRRL